MRRTEFLDQQETVEQLHLHEAIGTGNKDESERDLLRAAAELSSMLGHLPDALERAGAYIAHVYGCNMDNRLEQYIELVNDNNKANIIYRDIPEEPNKKITAPCLLSCGVRATVSMLAATRARSISSRPLLAK